VLPAQGSVVLAATNQLDIAPNGALARIVPKGIEMLHR
jgi:hypothetical protein